MSKRTIGTTARGIRFPVIKPGDDLVKITVEKVIAASRSEGFALRDRDIIGITESLVARAENNFASVDEIALEIKEKFPLGEIGVIFPILSRNRFSLLLKGIARGVNKVYLMLSYPRDEVGNALFSEEELESKKVNPYTDLLTLKQYRKLFGTSIHPFTGLDYISYYEELIRKEGAEVTILFANQPTRILAYTPHVLACDIHTRHHTKNTLGKAGAKTVYGLDDLLKRPRINKGFNPKYGLLGSNKATEETVKLFPRDGEKLVLDLQKEFLKQTGKHIEVLVYGDGAFKDPVGQIWELADPVVAPFFTPGLQGTPHEVKLKYLADNQFSSLKGEKLTTAIKKAIEEKKEDRHDNQASLGTTPRQISDLVGTLCDLISGSGDKGTPAVLIQGYFDDFTTE